MNIVEFMVTDVPPITRALCFFSCTLTFLAYIDIVSPYTLFFNLKLIWMKMQVYLNNHKLY